MKKKLKKKPKIGIFHYSSPPNISGVDLIINDQARLFNSHGFKVSVIAGRGEKFMKNVPVHIIKEMDPRNNMVLSVFKELKQGKVSDKFKKLEDDLYKSLRTYILKNKLEVCIVHNLFARPYNLALTSAFARLASNLKNVKFIGWIHDTISYDGLTSPENGLDKTYPWNLLVNSVPEITYVCVSNYLKNNLLKSFGEDTSARVEVVNNGQDIKEFWNLSPMMKSLFDDIDGSNCDLIGCIPVRAIPRKNLELAIHITKAMNDHGTNFKLLLTANKDYKKEENRKYFNELRKLTKEVGMEDKVFFLSEYFNKKNNPQQKSIKDIPITELYTISDFLLLTSKMEGFGLPLIEAGLMRCPIFAADIAVLREIGTTNINYFSLDLSATEIADFILEKIRRMPQAYFYRKVIKRFSLEPIFEKQVIPLVESIYKDK